MADFTDQNIEDSYKRVVQVDGNQLQDGSGSNLPISFDGNNVIVSGSITAHEYIVSSSVTNITIATKSGSTAFGDTLDDIHTFTGSIHVTGSINTDDNINVGSLKLYDGVLQASETNLGALTYHQLSGGASSQFQVFNVSGNTNLKLTNGKTEFLSWPVEAQRSVSASSFISQTHITASSNISASGTIFGNEIRSSQRFYAAGDTVINNSGVEISFGVLNRRALIDGSNIKLEGPVTASGNFKAHGYVSSSILRVGTGVLDDDQWHAPGLISSDNNISSSQSVIGSTGTFTELTNVNTTHVTASSTVYAPTGSFNVLLGDTSKPPGLEIQGYLLASSISASAGISSSGDILGTSVDVSYGDTNGIKISGTPLFYRLQNTLHIGPGISPSVGNVKVSGSGIWLDAPVTASNISASGNISASFVDSFGIRNSENILLNHDGVDYQMMLGKKAAGVSQISASSKILLSCEKFEFAPGGNLTIGQSDFMHIGGSVYVGGSINVVQGNITTNKTISASTAVVAGYISSSGDLEVANGIYANDYFIAGKNAIDYISNTDTILYGQTNAQFKVRGETILLGGATNQHVTASGNISSSGAIIAESGTFKDIAAVDLTGTLSTAAQTSITSLGTLTGLNVNGAITASSDISSSGKIIAADGDFGGSTINSGGIETSGPLSATAVAAGDLLSNGHISASGNIQAGGNVSASGNLYGNNFYSNGVKVIRHDNGVTNFGTSGNNGTFITGSYLKIGNDSSFHITASGDISASGDLHVGSIATLGTRLNANKIGNNGNVGNTEYGHLNGVTGPIQTQFNDISNVTSSYAVTGSDVLFNHITASGHISASGDVRAQTIYGHQFEHFTSTFKYDFAGYNTDNENAVFMPISDQSLLEHASSATSINVSRVSVVPGRPVKTMIRNATNTNLKNWQITSSVFYNQPGQGSSGAGPGDINAGQKHLVTAHATGPNSNHAAVELDFTNPISGTWEDIPAGSRLYMTLQVSSADGGDPGDTTYIVNNLWRWDYSQL